jgi:ribokinase
VVVGDVMVDVLARLPGPLVTGSDLPAPVRLLGGGSAANTACWLASAGVPTALVARVGDDALGRFSRAELDRQGVTGTTVDPDHSTGTCIVLVSADGQRTMVPDAGANAALCESDLPVFAASDHLHLSGYPLFNSGRAGALAALAAARRAGASISVDAASAGPLANLGASAFLDLIGADLLLFANVDEAFVLSGIEDPAASARALANHVGQVVLKLGADGAIWSDGSSEHFEPTSAIEPLDSTGAGDSFAAAVLAVLISGGDVATAIRSGHVVAARVCAQVGGRPR